MGLGLNFVCNNCNYDSGVLMLSQGDNHPIHSIIEKFLFTYSNEIDPQMLSYRMDLYKMIDLYLSSHPERKSTYYYHGCVCYGCRRTYEILDLFEKKAEEVYAGDTGSFKLPQNPLNHIFEISNSRWSSLIGEELLCLFCERIVKKISNQSLKAGIHCPKCEKGLLQVGNDFQLWD
ncbi:MAG TPA: hypothetical protein VJ824_08255 [Bacillota bacterium]|nr:hypothetical protein [Bacillota bacterium]